MLLQTSSTTKTNAPETGAFRVNDTPLSSSPAPQKARVAPDEESSVSVSEVEAAIQQWHFAQAKRSQRERAHQSWLAVRLFLILCASLATPLLLLLTSNPYLIAGIIAGMALLIVAVGARYAPPTASRGAETIAEMEDIRAIGPLLEILSGAFWQEQEAICSALTHLLPHLQAEKAGLLPPSQWQALVGCVTKQMSERHPEFVTACLEALERVGDENAFPCLALLVVQDAPTQAMQAVRARAKQCLRHLTARLDFGTVQDIPAWIAKLPRADDYTSEHSKVLSDRAWDEYLIATFALTRLLPQLTPTDAGLLNREARSRLGESVSAPRYALTHGDGKHIPGGVVMTRLGSDYDLARLAAFEQIGAGSDIPYAQYCLNAHTPAEDLPLMRARTKTALAILEARREKEEVGQTLLRGASAPPTPSGELLRPAQADAAHTVPGELLRPVTAEQVHSDPKELRNPEEK